MATSNGRMRRHGLILVCTLALAQPAWAQLFGNSAELTRQIQAQQQRVDALDARIGKLESAMQKNEQLLGLLKEVETLKAEIAKMRGQAEVQAHQLETLGKRQNDLYADLDQRIGDLAKAAQPAPAADAAQPAPSDAASSAAAGNAPHLDPLVESRSYETALGLFREANYPGAIAGFNGFLKAYPDSALAANAQYWIGYSYYALKDYKTALAHQQKLVAVYPASPKVPDALLNIAANQIALDNLTGARKTLEEIVAKHPGTNAATLAARRLSALK
ncbi:MAG: tol-pal system protein YbgF [Thiobacillus sp.]|nr:tol-pal system protein YbgF [Thiobacillus sp.]